ncbi:Beta-lactamase enzyme family protein [Cyclonatronum proteinivorum]|uniref:Beta-lactamase enzyme family protein n=1 Tax=Cyclonatronum proteinivorum TaxID=1457365 RepID=A0A345UJJ9_9BACT|nr:serine hydrolase [Cyclonatronum proteinivorum]AXJ00651.1 Beta-lactamase enzyme family protein [Cyclonatronum proteinivorum]
MKAFKTLLIFFVITASILGLVVGLNWTAFKVVFSDPESFSEGSEWIEKTYSLAGLVEFMEAAPEHVSLVSLNLTTPDDSILYNAETPRVMGALSNLFLLMEFERQYQAGELNPNDRIHREEIDAFLVPTWYENTHRNAMRSVETTNGTMALRDVRYLVSRNYSQAASDWLFFYLGAESVNALIDSVGAGRIEPWIPGSGLQIAVIMRDEDTEPHTEIARLHEMDTEERLSVAKTLSQRYVQDSDFAAEVGQRAGHIRNRLLADERATHRLWSRAEPLKLAEILADVMEGRFISTNAGARILEPFGWAFEDPVVQQHASEYGALFGSRLGFQTGMDFGTSVYTGNRFAQVLFFDDLPVAFYLHMSSNHMNQDLQRRLIYDPELRRLTRLASEQRLTPRDETDAPTAAHTTF